jgi:signal transduction histidine kinase
MLQHLAKRAQVQKSPLAEEIDQLSTLANSAIISAHDMAHGLLPVELRHGDLRTVIEALAQTARRAHNVKFRVRFGGLRALYPEGRVAEHLYRIAQESVNNAIRHGAATRITLSMRATAKKTTFSISDNGSGPRRAQAMRGVGLQIMSYRMRVLRGWITFSRRPEGGARVMCVLPSGAILDGSLGQISQDFRRRSSS